ncbi:MAG: hypothetical protein NTZ56_13640 [Acidobacteria bacterium]|nr:hypothetical protein [Acidobacteriota bacterium]
MTIDERLERLTERHQALVESVELFVASTRENFQSTNAGLARVGTMVDQLVVAVQQTNESVASLLTVVESHQRRISGLEGA